MEIRIFGFLALALVIALAACSGGTNYVGGSLSETTYTVTIEAMTNGTVASDKTTGISSGSTVTLTITPATGKVLDKFQVKDASNNAIATKAVVAGTTYTFTMPEGNVRVTVTFKSATLGSKAAPDAVGDIVFNDGSAESYSDSLTLTSEQIAGAVAVIFDATNKLGVGLHQGTSKAWAISTADGYTNSIAGLLCATSALGPGKAGDTTVTFTGTTDGSTSLAKLKAAVSDYNATNYPAWAFVESYATTAGLTGTYANGWYMPSIAELCKLYQGVTNGNVDNALNKIADSIQISTTCYWSSSIATFSGAYSANFRSGYLGYSNKINEFNDISVCVVRAF